MLKELNTTMKLTLPVVLPLCRNKAWSQCTRSGLQETGKIPRPSYPLVFESMNSTVSRNRDPSYWRIGVPPSRDWDLFLGSYSTIVWVHIFIRGPYFPKFWTHESIILPEPSGYKEAIMNCSWAFQIPKAAKTWMRSMTASSLELASRSASSQVHLSPEDFRMEFVKNFNRAILIHIEKIYIQECSRCLGRKFSTWTGICCVLRFSPHWNSWLSEISIMEVNLPPWLLWRSFSPSLEFLPLMRAMEGEGEPHITGTCGFQPLPQWF